VGRSDHVDVVGSVADGERGGVLLLVLDQIDDFCLLLGRNPAGEDDRGLFG